MHTYATFLVLELLRERADEASRERLAAESRRAAHHGRPSFGDRLRAFVAGLTGAQPAADDRSGVPAPSH